MFALVNPRNPYWKGSNSTVDLLAKIAYFVKNEKKYAQYQKQVVYSSQYKELNRTEPSPSERIPLFFRYRLTMH